MDVAGMDVAGCGLCGVAHVDAAVGAAALHVAAHVAATHIAATHIAAATAARLGCIVCEVRVRRAVMGSNDKLTERSLKTPEGVSVYCYILSLIFFKQSRRELLVVTYALDEVCLASADGFVNFTEARFELSAR